MTKRTRRSVAGSVLVVLGLVIGAVIVTALQAEGRERSKADTNDGGAWLLKRDAPVEVALAGAEHVAETAPADRLELVEPVDAHGRDGWISGAGHDG